MGIWQQSVPHKSLEEMMWANHEHIHSTGEAELVSSPPTCLLLVIAELEGPQYVSGQWLHWRPGQRHMTDDTGTAPLTNGLCCRGRLGCWLWGWS